MIGRTLGHYEIIEPLGAGGMGEVYRARDTSLKREVALKVLLQDFTSSRERLERFQREAEALAALDHPNIVTIHSVEEAEGVRFLTMQLVEGEQLSELIPESGMPLARIFDIAIPLADALTTAHGNDIVHRDLKPGNIMVTDEGRVKVLDFGLAKLRHETAPEEATELPTELLTQEGRILGTMPYMSPEQLEGKDVDSRSDIFSLGAVLYEMATGERPFRGDTSVSLISSIVKDDPRPVDAIRENLPHHLGRIIRRCLEKDRERRFQSAKEIRNELEDLKTEVVSGSGEAASPVHALRPRAMGRVAWVAGLAVLATMVAIAGLYLYRDWTDSRGSGETTGTGIESLAVLPLENLSGDSEQEFFADGMTDELISHLTQIGALRVTSRTSAMQYKGTSKYLPEIAQELGVDAIVEGTVRLSGGRVRITATLIDAVSDQIIWTDNFERDLRDVLALQNEVALEIVREIEIALTPDEEARLTTARPVDPEAHMDYLRGRDFAFTWTEESLQQSINLFNQAIAHDPNFARAYAGLADSYVMMSNFAFLSPSEAGPQAKDAATRALEIDDSLAEAHAALASAEMMFDWNLISAGKRFERALELNPGDFYTLWGYSFYFLIMGRFADCLELQQQALELDPVTVNIRMDMGFTLFNMRSYQESIDQVQASLPLDPDSWAGHTILASAYSKAGRDEDAVQSAERLLSIGEDDQQSLAVAAWALGLAGRDQRAREVADRLFGLAPERWVDPFYEAVALAGLGEIDQAMDKLELGYAERSPLMTWIRFSPWFDPLRDDPRFQALLDRMPFPD